MALPQIPNVAVVGLAPSGPSSGIALNPAFSALNIAPATITAVSISNSVLTITAANSFAAGMKLYLSGLVTATFLNGQFVIVLSATSTSFSVAYAYTGVYSAVDSGVANVVYYFLVSGRDLVTFYNTDTLASPPVNDTFTLFSAPDDVGRKADIVNYVVPEGKFTEFLVLASSYYTQNDGTVQFITNTTNLSVLVRSI